MQSWKGQEFFTPSYNKRKWGKKQNKTPPEGLTKKKKRKKGARALTFSKRLKTTHCGGTVKAAREENPSRGKFDVQNEKRKYHVAHEI